MLVINVQHVIEQMFNEFDSDFGSVRTTVNAVSQTAHLRTGGVSPKSGQNATCTQEKNISGWSVYIHMYVCRLHTVCRYIYKAQMRSQPFQHVEHRTYISANILTYV